jgi:hypothetical protein
MLAATMTRKYASSQPAPSRCHCKESYQLLDEFLDAVHELNVLHTLQTRAVIRGERDFSRFDLLIYLAHERKDSVKYAWMAHIEKHHCEELWP